MPSGRCSGERDPVGVVAESIGNYQTMDRRERGGEPEVQEDGIPETSRLNSATSAVEMVEILLSGVTKQRTQCLDEPTNDCAG